MRSLEGARRFDLHLHSTRSDGAFDPSEVLRRCAAGRLDVVALTDHDLSTALPPGRHDIDGHTLHVLAGAELSGRHEDAEYHLLVYFPAEPPAAFRAFCTERARARAARYATALERLQLHDLAAPDDAALRGERSLTRHHLARDLVAKGHAADLRDAFQRFAATGPHQVPCTDLPFVEAIRVAREAGGITSWAHPPLAALDAHLATFVRAGLQGLEALRPQVPAREHRKLTRLAKRYGLVLTGGSDWHGWREPEPGLFYVERAPLQPFLDALARAA